MTAKKKPVVKKMAAKKKPVVKKMAAKKKPVVKKMAAKKKPVAKKKVASNPPCPHSAAFDIRVFTHISRLRCSNCGTTWFTSSTNSGDLAQLKRTIVYAAKYKHYVGQL